MIELLLIFTLILLVGAGAIYLAGYIYGFFWTMKRIVETNEDWDDG